MTRKQVMNRLQELGIKDCESKYYEIQSFLYANRTPIKAITNITLDEEQYGDENWEVTIELGEFGSFEC